MNKKVLTGLIFLGFLCSFTSVKAAGDAEAGAKIANTVCIACHDTDGKGTTPQFPNLGGQVSGYIASQLKAFKSGMRENAIMAGQVANLSEQDMENLDAHYAGLPAVPGSIAESDVEKAEKAAKLFRGGDSEMQIAACIACHGPAGHGIPTRFPRIAGQQVDYLKAQLLAFKSGARKSEGDIMNQIAFLLSEEQIESLSIYMHGLQ